MATFAGEVEVTVTPDTSKFGEKLEAGAITAATKAGERIGKAMGDVIATRVANAVRSGLDRGVTTAAKSGAKAGGDFGKAFATTANAEMKKNLNTLQQVRVRVLADTSKARAEVDGFASKAAESLARKVSEGLEKGAESGSRKIPNRAPKAGTEYGGKFAAALKSRLEAALRDLPDAKIDADSSDADRAIAGIREELETLRDRKIGVEITTQEALRKTEELRQRLAVLGYTSPDVAVKVDAAAASANLAAFQTEVSKVDGKTATVNVDVDTGAATAELAALGDVSNGTSSRFAKLVLAAAALGPALIPLGAAGAGAMAAIAGGAVAAASGVGVLALAMAPVIGAFQALSQAEKQSASAARSGASSANAQANAQDALREAVRRVAVAKRDAAEAAEASEERVADAERGVEQAVRDSVKTQTQNSRRVEDARRRLADTVARAAERQVQADRRVQDAERNLASAQRDVLRAQEDLNEARGLAARDMEDLASRAVNGTLDERDAKLDLAEAEAELAKASSEDRERAQLAYDRAVQRLKDIQRENQRVAQEQAKAAQSGVDGSERVQSAQEALLAAQERAAEAARARDEAAAQRDQDRIESARDVQTAEEDLAEVVVESAERQRESAEKVAGAQRDLAAAVTQSERQQRDSAEAIVQAQQAVVQAHRGVQAASQSAGASGGSAMEEARKKLAALTPEGRAFVTFLKDELVPAFNGLSGTAQSNLLPGLQSGLASLIPLMPVFRDLVASVSQAMGTLFSEAGKALRGPFWTEFFAFLKDTAGPTLLIMGRTLGQVVKAFAGLGIAFQPVAEKFGAGLLNLTTRFANFAENAGKNPEFQRFLAYLIETGPLVASTIGSIGSAIGNLIRAFAPLGAVILAVIGQFGNLIAAVPPGVLQFLVTGIVGIVVAMKALAVIIPVVNTVMAVLNGTLALNPVTVVVVALVALVAALVAAYQHSETFREIVQTVWEAVKTAIQVAWTSVIKPVLEALWGFIEGTLIPVFLWLWRNVMIPVWQGIQVAVQVAGAALALIFQGIVGYVQNVLIPVFRTFLLPVIQFVWNLIQVAISVAWAFIQVIWKAIEIYIRAVLAPVFRWLYENIIKPVWDDIAATVKFVWEAILRPVLSAFGDFISTRVAPAFSAGVAAIKTAWDRVVEIAKVPVRFVVEQVINGGIIRPFNTIAKAFGVSPINEIVLPDFFQSKKTGKTGSENSGPGYADGGEVPGHLGTPGVDSVPALLMPDEHVWTTREVAGAGGHAAVARIRALAAAGLLRGYALGGAVQAVRTAITNPAGFLRSKLDAVIGKVADFGDNAFIRLLTAIPKKLLDLAIERVSGMFGLGGEGAQPIPGGMGWQQQWALVKAQFPSAVLTSAYRPGAITSSGNPSYHSMGRAIDVTPSMQIFDWIRENFGAASKELIFTPAGARQIKDGRPFLYGGQVAQDHYNHVHWAFDQGGYLPTGLSQVYNGTGRPEPVLTPDQWETMRRSMDRPSISADVKVYNPVPETASESTTRVMRRLASVGARG